MKIAIINGPNLNLLGRREPEIYGNKSFEEYFVLLQETYKNVELTYFQSNIEGEIVTKIQETGYAYDGIVLNAAAYTHTSIAIADAVSAIKCAVVEVHISNIYKREKFRHKSMIAAKCAGSISGFGLFSYDLAINALVNLKK